MPYFMDDDAETQSGVHNSGLGLLNSHLSPVSALSLPLLQGFSLVQTWLESRFASYVSTSNFQPLPHLLLSVSLFPGECLLLKTTHAATSTPCPGSQMSLITEDYQKAQSTDPEHSPMPAPVPDNLMGFHLKTLWPYRLLPHFTDEETKFSSSKRTCLREDS